MICLKVNYTLTTTLSKSKCQLRLHVSLTFGSIRFQVVNCSEGLLEQNDWKHSNIEYIDFCSGPLVSVR